MKMMETLSSLSPRAAFGRVTGLHYVEDNSGVTVHRLGRYVRTLGPGWHWILPGVDRLGRPVRLIGHHLDVPTDGAHADLYYQILDPARAGAALDRVDALVQAQTRDAIAAVRPEPGRSLSELLKAELNRRVAAHGLRVIRCSLPPPENRGQSTFLRAERGAGFGRVGKSTLTPVFVSATMGA